jgi:hypothetical protein
VINCAGRRLCSGRVEWINRGESVDYMLMQVGTAQDNTWTLRDSIQSWYIVQARICAYQLRGSWDSSQTGNEMFGIRNPNPESIESIYPVWAHVGSCLRTCTGSKNSGHAYGPIPTLVWDIRRVLDYKAYYWSKNESQLDIVVMEQVVDMIAL